MPKIHVTALLAGLAFGAVASRLAAQDTSSAGQARPDTSGYTGVGGVDTSAMPGRVGATDSSNRSSAATDTVYLGNPRGASNSDTSAGSARMKEAPGRIDATDTTGALGASDTSGMCGRHADSTKMGDTAGARSRPCTNTRTDSSTQAP